MNESGAVRGRTIADIPLGLKTRVTKTVSETDVYLFAGITGDFDQNHVDEEFCKKTSLGHRVAHGALVLGYTSAASSQILHAFDRPMVSVGYDRVRFLKPVYFGDTITVDYEITEAVPEKERLISKVEVFNQRGELVMVATHLMQLVD
ncbi:MAG: MaoC family dehydratase N-terminal domain-containing protein [Candidatus Dormibacteraeota bacterium]|nr:MaoC family dehydratase N-terminal domain-containing protein [Candidatus Dormibacteraeota bacterium]